MSTVNFFDDDDGSLDRSTLNNNFDESYQLPDSPTPSTRNSPHASTSNLNQPQPPRRAQGAGGSSSSYRGAGGAGSSVQGRADTRSRGFSPTLDEILAGGDGDLGDGDDEFGLGELLTGRKRESNTKKLLRCLNNEIGAPELLRFPATLVERVVKDLARRKEQFEDQSALVNQKEGHYVKWALIATENMRASHVLKQFLRTRIYKIEKYARYYLRDENLEDTLGGRMYQNEIDHARGFLELCDNYFKSACMDGMPDKVKSLDDPGIVPTPDLSTAVFVRVRKDCGVVVIPE